jgi:hypothetical protein
MRVFVAPRVFAIPDFRRFRGYATGHLVLLKGPEVDADLVVHELRHAVEATRRGLDPH